MSTDNDVCVFNTHWAFNDFIDALKPFIRKDDCGAKSMIYLEGKKDTNRVTGWSCDGHTLAKQICLTVDVLEDFSGYINIPRLKANADDRFVTIKKDKDGALLVAFGDVTFRSRQPSEQVDYKTLYERCLQPDADMLHIGLDRRKLALAATSLYDRASLCGGNFEKPIIFSIPENPFKAVHMQVGDNERFVLPVRTKLPESNVLTRERKDAD